MGQKLRNLKDERIQIKSDFIDKWIISATHRALAVPFKNSVGINRYSMWFKGSAAVAAGAAIITAMAKPEETVETIKNNGSIQ